MRVLFPRITSSIPSSINVLSRLHISQDSSPGVLTCDPRECQRFIKCRESKTHDESLPIACHNTQHVLMVILDTNIIQLCVQPWWRVHRILKHTRCVYTMQQLQEI